MKNLPLYIPGILKTLLFQDTVFKWFLNYKVGHNAENVQLDSDITLDTGI